jgi:hypothetical protein
LKKLYLKESFHFCDGFISGMASLKTIMQLSKEAAKPGGLELAKEVPAPIASMVALGGFEAWWILSSRAPKGPKTMTAWQKQETMPARASSRAGRDAGINQSPEIDFDGEFDFDDDDDEGYVPVDDPDEETESGHANNSSVTAHEQPKDEDVVESAKKIIAQAQKGRRQRAGHNQEDQKKEDFFNAIMQGDKQFVKAALNPDSLLWPNLSPESCDDYGNSLLILATQVMMHL